MTHAHGRPSSADVLARITSGTRPNPGHLLHALLDSFPEHIYFKSRDSRFTLVNRAMARYFGIEDPGDVVGRSDADFYPAEDVARYRDDEERVMASGEALLGKVESCVTGSGSIRWFATTKSPIRTSDGEIVGIVGISRDVTVHRQMEMLREGEARLLDRISCGETLANVLGELIVMIERQSRGLLGSVQVMHESGTRLINVAAPSLPAEYVQATRDVPVGPAVGSCGTAAHRRETVIVSDIRTDPLWAAHRHLALPHGLLACWSRPMLSSAGDVIGTFAMYFREPRRPTAQEIALINSAASLAAIAIERQRAMEALRQEQHLLRTLMDCVPDKIYFKDVEGRFTRVNAALAEFLGLDRPAQAVGRTDADFYPPDLADQFRADETRLFRTNTPLIGQVEHGGRDGNEMRWHSTTKIPIRDDEGNPVGLVGISRDITDRMRIESQLRVARDAVEARVAERTRELSQANETLRREIVDRRRVESALRESERRFRQLAENVREVFWLVDCGSRNVIYVSPAYEAVFGRDPRHLYEKRLGWPDAVAPGHRERVREAFRKRGMKGRFEEEYEIVRPDGSTRWIRDRGFPILDDDGNVYRIAGIAEDITERREAERVLVQRETELAHVARLSTLGEMAAGLAHELNQPLAAIVNYCEAALREMRATSVDTGAVAGDLEQVVEQAVRAGAIIRRLHGFARKQPSARAPSSLNELVEELLPLLAHMSTKHGVTIVTELEPDLPSSSIDRIQIQQVLLNLACNGIEAMRDAEGLRERVLTIATRRAGDEVQVTVSNTGPSIDEGDLDRMFDPFFTSKPSGLGLGLAIAQRIVLAHEGALHVEPNRDDGAAFSFVLPVMESADDA